jgi:septation ring formation regulator EzrA
MSEDQFTKLFKYMQTEFAAVRREIAAMNQRFDAIERAVDHLIHDYDILVSEEAANAVKWNRLSDKVHEHDEKLADHDKSIKKLLRAGV